MSNFASSTSMAAMGASLPYSRAIEATLQTRLRRDGGEPSFGPAPVVESGRPVPQGAPPAATGRAPGEHVGPNLLLAVVDHCAVEGVVDGTVRVLLLSHDRDAGLPESRVQLEAAGLEVALFGEPVLEADGEGGDAVDHRTAFLEKEARPLLGAWHQRLPTPVEHEDQGSLPPFCPRRGALTGLVTRGMDSSPRSPRPCCRPARAPARFSTPRRLSATGASRVRDWGSIPEWVLGLPTT